MSSGSCQLFHVGAQEPGASAEDIFTARRKMFSAGPLTCPPTSAAKHPSLIKVRITLGNRL